LVRSELIALDVRGQLAIPVNHRRVCGGHMAFRLALEAPTRFRAVAAVPASVPTPENFKCKPAGQGTSSVMIMNGTRDPINPFEGGEVKFLGLLKRGKVRSSLESGQYLADLTTSSARPKRARPK
jgi:polyhydroxybutyrate depolymerase